jgi:hypothetical protein
VAASIVSSLLTIRWALIYQLLDVVHWIGLAQESSCVLGNEPSGSIKCWETIEWLHNFLSCIQLHRVS